MKYLVANLWHDEAGFVISAELILVSTVTVLAMVVGLSEVAYGINQELEDTGSSFGSINQSYRYTGMTGHVSDASGSNFRDLVDFCDAAGNISSSHPTPEL